VTAQTATETTAVSTGAHSPDVAHGYPPPAQPAGSIVVAYCGEPMVVRGEFSHEPPVDTCAECVAIWKRKRRSNGRC